MSQYDACACGGDVGLAHAATSCRDVPAMIDEALVMVCQWTMMFLSVMEVGCLLLELVGMDIQERML